MKRILCLILAAVIVLIFCSCRELLPQEEAQQPQPRPEIRVSIASDLESYAAVRVLLDETLRSSLEEKLQVNIELIELGVTRDSDQASEIVFSGILLSDNPLWLVPLAEQKRLAEIGSVPSMEDSALGQYQGIQYGYVFSESESNATRPVLLARKDLLEQLGLQGLPYTPESMRSILTALSALTEIPLVVYGSPAETGFFPLQGMYEISPSGGREFRLDEGNVIFDKLSDQAMEYLTYANELYAAGYIPKNFLILSEYSAAELLSSGRCAMAVFTKQAIAEDTVAWAEQSGLELVAVELPVADSRVEAEIYHRLTGAVSSDCGDVALAKQLLEELEKLARELPAEEQNLDVPTYPLFSYEKYYHERMDPVELSTRDLRRLYEKYSLDEKLIHPYYCRIVTGDLPVSAFSTMCSDWLGVAGSNEEVIGDGELLLYLFREYYYDWLERQ